MKRKGLILAVLAAIVAAVMGLAACNGNGDTTPVQYTITFETNGGSIVAPMTVDEGGSVNLPTPTKADFTFDGWFDNATLNGSKLSSPYTPTANVTLYAKWEVAQYTVSFETNDGNITINPVTVEGGKSVDLPTPEKPYFTFVGWFDNVDLNGDRLSSPYTPTSNMTLYAKWEVVRYTVSFETNGGNAAVDAVTAEGEKSVDLPTPEKPYFTFVGWFDNEDLNGDKLSSPYTPTANVTLYAKWEVAQYTVSFETDGGISAYDPVTVEGGKSVDLPTPEKTYFTFVGWFDNATLNGSKLSSPYFPTANMTLYSKWEAIVDPNETYFTFEEIKENSDTVIGYSVALVSGTVPSNFYVPISHKGNPVLTVKSLANENIKELIIPDSVTEIESGAFSGCDNLEKITLPFVGRYADATKGGATYLGYIFGASSYNYNSTYVPAKLKTVVVNGGTIGTNAFRGCSGLTSVTIGSGVKSIGNSAFSDCSKLASVKWNAINCTSAGSYDYPIFSGCTSLTSVDFGDGVETIPYYAFKDCSGLTAVYYTGDIAEWCGISFGNAYSNPLYYAHDLYINNTLVTVLIIPETVTSIGEGAFWGCSSLTSVTIGSGVTSIGRYAFRDCSGLTSITIPDSVTSIGEYAFYGCSSLTSITIPDSVEGIDSGAFWGCSSLTSVTIGSGVTSIGHSAFSGCSKLTSITIPDSVTSIGNYAFIGCIGLTSIAFKGTKAQWIAISKDSDWASNAPSFTVECTDGTLSKSEAGGGYY